MENDTYNQIYHINPNDNTNNTNNSDISDDNTNSDKDENELSTYASIILNYNKNSDKNQIINIIKNYGEILSITEIIYLINIRFKIPFDILLKKKFTLYDCCKINVKKYKNFITSYCTLKMNELNIDERETYLILNDPYIILNIYKKIPNICNFSYYIINPKVINELFIKKILPIMGIIDFYLQHLQYQSVLTLLGVAKSYYKEKFNVYFKNILCKNRTLIFYIYEDFNDDEILTEDEMDIIRTNNTRTLEISKYFKTYEIKREILTEEKINLILTLISVNETFRNH